MLQKRYRKIWQIWSAGFALGKILNKRILKEVHFKFIMKLKVFPPSGTSLCWKTQDLYLAIFIFSPSNLLKYFEFIWRGMGDGGTEGRENLKQAQCLVLQPWHDMSRKPRVRRLTIWASQVPYKFILNTPSEVLLIPQQHCKCKFFFLIVVHVTEFDL